MKKLLVACAAFGGLSGAAFASPYDHDSGIVLDVPYADLNLDHPVGAEVMLQRIKFAAVVACGGRPDLVDLRMYRIFKFCVQDAVDDAVEQLDAPLVISLYKDHIASDRRYAYR